MTSSHTIKRRIAAVVLMLALFGTLPASADVIAVPCATADLVAAINTSNATPAADTLTLAAGCVYSVTNAADVDPTLGDSALPRITTPIVIEGNGATIERAGGAPAFRLFHVNAGGDLTLDDVTVRGGLANGSGEVGGGIANLTGTLTVTNSTISGNSASIGSGGGIYSLDGSLTVAESTISGNSASIGGGILNNDGGSLTVTDSTISGNSATIGGGIVNINGGTLSVTDSTISGNNADGSGGGIANGTAIAAVTNSTISGNSADSGGGIFNGGTLAVTNSTISGNNADDNGGGIANLNGTAAVMNSTISGNSASNGGGGIANLNGTAAVMNSTISGNRASIGSGGGIYIDSSSTMTMTNGIVWGNSSSIQGIGAKTVSHSIIQGGPTGTTNLDTDPLFVDPVLPASAPTILGDYRLQANSPALNVGDNAAIPPDTYDLDGDSDTTDPAPDRDGNPRIVNATVDMGAYEHQTPELLVNGGFEDSSAGLPDHWTVKAPESARLVCKPEKANSGDCAFKVKRWAQPRVALLQSVDLTGLSFSTGDGLTLSVYMRDQKALGSIKAVLTVAYDDAPADKVKRLLSHGGDFALFTLDTLTLNSDTVATIKVKFKQKATSGAVVIDDASLIWTPIPSRGPARADSDVLPPPAAPDGFRGGN